MNRDEFWDLTWYDFGLWCLRIAEISKKRLEDKEFSIELTRSFMALHSRMNGVKAQPTDFWKLSYDEKDSGSEVNEEDKEALAKTIKRLEAKAKNKLKGG